jgi:hypothetical protein
VAEQLGQAQLQLTVDDRDLRKKLGEARTLLESLDTRPIKLRIESGASDGLRNTQAALRNVSTEADRAAVRIQSLNQVLNSPLPGSYARISAQISRLTSDSRELQITSAQYLKVLTRISELENVRANRVGRQRVNADFEAFQGETLNGGFGDPSRLPSLPNTVAADQQLIVELTQRLTNLDKNSSRYSETLRELTQAQTRVRDALSGVSDGYRKLERDEERAIRRAEKIRGRQEYLASKRPQASGIRDDNGAMRNRGFGSTFDEWNYNQAIRPSRQLLEQDLQRAQALREVSRRLQEQAGFLDRQRASGSSFGAASASNFGTSDAVQKAIRRNEEKVSKQADLEGRAREDSLRITQDLLAADLKREQALRQIAARIREAAEASREGFGAASASNFGTSDPVQKSIRRNQEKVARQEGRNNNQLEALDADLQRVREARVKQEKQLLELSKRDAQRQRRLEKFDAQQAKARSDRQAGGRKRAGEAFSSGLIGGAFPALFGQGIGASVGGGIGGVLGGFAGNGLGFGLSLIGTSLGASLDSLTEALKSPIQNFQALKDAALLSNRGLEKQVEGLIEVGRVSEANALIQQDLVSRFGSAGLKGVQDLGNATDELARSWAELTTAFAVFAAGPLREIVKLLTTDVNNVSTATQFQNLKLQLNPEQDAQVRQVTDRATRDAQLTRLRKEDPNYRDGLIRFAPSEGDVAQGRKAGIEEAKRLLGIKKEEEELEKKIAAARALTTKELSNSYRLISAQVQGNRTAQLDERSKGAIDTRNQRLRELATQKITSPTDARVIEANQVAAKELFRIEEERLQLQKEIARTMNEEFLKRQQIAQQIAVTRAQREAALAQGDAAANPGNSFLAARAGSAEGAAFLAQNQQAVQDAQRRASLLRSQLAQESDPTRQAQLVQQIRTAAQETKLAFEQAGTALAERASQAAASLQGARDSLRSTLESNTKLIPRAQSRALQDQAKADIERGRRTGILRENLRTPGSRSRQFEVAGFVRNVEQQQAQIASQQALIEALNSNAKAERNIRINVTANGDGSYSIDNERQAALL